MSRTDMASPALRVNAQVVDAAAFYRVACDPQRHVVVEACAGAGKTWMLVSRILRALLEGAAPQDILAITFTKKAAAEMRARLDEWLQTFALCSAQERIEALLQRGCTPGQAAQWEPELAALFSRVIDAGRPVEIRTFHAWFAQLMRSAPLQLLQSLNLHGDMQLIEDVSELHAVLWRRFLRQVRQDASASADLDALIQAKGRAGTQAWLMALLAHPIEFDLAEQAGVLDNAVPSAAQVWPEFAGLSHPLERLGDASVQRSLSQLAQQLGAVGKAKATTAASGIGQALGAVSLVQCWDALKSALLTDKGEPRKQLGEAPLLHDMQDWVLQLQEANAQHDAHELHGRMVRLGRALLHEFSALKRERGLADMFDLERCALYLLRDAELSAWVQERLDARLRHVLIDEFQDTSALQWHTIHAWLSSYAGAGGGAQSRPSLFIVGDPKQSIYRFRGAEPRVFVAAQSLVREGFGGDLLSSDHTRRNAQAVVDVVNAVFDGPGPHAAAFAEFRRHTSASQLPGAVRQLPLVERPAALARTPADASAQVEWRHSLSQSRYAVAEKLRAQEVAKVGAAIGHLLQEGVAAGEIYVLSRKRSHLMALASVLRQAGLPHALQQDHVLMDNALVRDVVALLDFLVSPTHDLSLAQALRSPIFSIDDADMMALASRVRGSKKTWWQGLVQWVAPGDSQASGQEGGDQGITLGLTPARASAPLVAAYRYLTQWRLACAQLPPHDLLDRIVAQGRLRERYAQALPSAARSLALEHLDALLAEALQLDGGRFTSPYRFVRALKQRTLKVSLLAASQAVQLLTIHAAKGLEAKIVFLMDVHPEPAKSDSGAILVDWPADEPVPKRFAFVESFSKACASLRPWIEQELQARELEERNTLYVALTRAKEMLVLSSTQPRARQTATSWYSHLQGLALDTWEVASAAPTGAADGGAPGEPAIPSLYNLPSWREMSALSSGGPPLHADAAASVGTAVHRVLEWLTRLPMAGRAERLELAVQRACASAGLAATHHQVVQELAQRILHSEALAHLLDPAQALWADNEVSLAVGGQVLRIDRLVCLRANGQTQWWVLDYKINRSPQSVLANRAQLKQYAQAVQALQPGEQVYAAFLTGQGELMVLEDAATE